MIDRFTRKTRIQSLLWSKRLIQALSSARMSAGKKRVVLVAGVQRSGTTMMMEILERSFETEVQQRRDPRADDGHGRVTLDALHERIRSMRASQYVFKVLRELHLVRQLLDEFAPARCVWMLRHYEDVVNSHMLLWDGMPRRIGEIVDDRHGAAGWRGHGMSDETHAMVSQLFHPDISNASAVALFWYFRNVLYFEQQLEREERVRLVRYEPLVADPQRQFAELFAFLGLRYSERISKPVFSTSIRKQQPPDIEPPIRTLCASLLDRFDTVGR